MDASNTPIFLDTVNGTKQTRTGRWFAFIFRMLYIWLPLWESEGMSVEMPVAPTVAQAGSACSLLRSLVIPHIPHSQSIG